MGNTAEEELRSVLIYYGENPDSPETPKHEDFFGLIVSFSSSLQVSIPLAVHSQFFEPVIPRNAQ